MKKFLFAVAAIALFVARSASAGVVGTVADWAALPGQSFDDGDKRYTFISSNGFDGTELVGASHVEASELYSLNIVWLGGLTGPQDLTLDYSVMVFVGGETIVNAVVDTTHTADGVHAVKELYTGAGHTGLIGASTSDNGVPGADVAIPSLTTVYVHDHVTVDALGQITGLSNTVTQATPEPSSFVLVGIAAVGGLVYSRRRNKA